MSHSESQRFGFRELNIHAGKHISERLLPKVYQSRGPHDDIEAECSFNWTCLHCDLRFRLKSHADLKSTKGRCR